jgi:hypothetical protein
VAKGPKRIKKKKPQVEIQKAQVSQSPSTQKLDVLPQPTPILAQSFAPSITLPVEQLVSTQESISQSTLLGRLGEIATKRLLHAFDDMVALILSAVSVAVVYWVMKKVLLFAGIEEHSFKFTALSYLLFFIEASLLLKFLWDRLRK